MTLSANVNTCINSSYQGSYSGNIVFSEAEAILNGTDASKTLTFNMAMNTSVVFRLTETSLKLIWILTGTGMASGVGTTYGYTMNAGTADITIKLFT